MRQLLLAPCFFVVVVMDVPESINTSSTAAPAAAAATAGVAHPPSASSGSGDTAPQNTPGVVHPSLLLGGGNQQTPLLPTTHSNFAQLLQRQPMATPLSQGQFQYHPMGMVVGQPNSFPHIVSQHFGSTSAAAVNSDVAFPRTTVEMAMSNTVTSLGNCKCCSNPKKQANDPTFHCAVDNCNNYVHHDCFQKNVLDNNKAPLPNNTYVCSKSCYRQYDVTSGSSQLPVSTQNPVSAHTD